MGILGGSLGYVRFYVEGGVPRNFEEIFEQAIEARRFAPMHAHMEEMETSGWVPLEKPYVDDEPITQEHFLFHDKIVIAYREDSVALPKPLLRAKIEQRLAKYRDENGRNPPSETKRAIEQAVAAELKQKVLPKSKIVDVMWDISRSEVRFFARGKGITERLQDFFERTFDVRLRQKTYPEQAISADISSRAKGLLDTLGPQELFPTPHRTEV